MQPRTPITEIRTTRWRRRVRDEDHLTSLVRLPTQGLAAANGLDAGGGGRQAELLRLAGQRYREMDKTPTVDFAARCDTVFGTPGTFATMRDLVAREVWPSYFAPGHRPGDQRHPDPRVGDARRPGLLQTEEYARAVISAGKRRDSSAAIDRAVSTRLERQAILARENPPMLWHVLYVGVLQHVVGSPAIMRAQLDKLAELAHEPGMVIQVLPFTAADHPRTVRSWSTTSTAARRWHIPSAKAAAGS